MLQVMKHTSGALRGINAFLLWQFYASRKPGPRSRAQHRHRRFKRRYVAFVDVDDQLCPQMFEQLLQRIDERQVDVAICGITITDRIKK